MEEAGLVSILSFLKGWAIDLERVGGVRKGREKVKSQFFAPLEMFVIIEKVIPALGPGARIYATILSQVGGMRLTKRMAEYFEFMAVIGGHFRSGSRVFKRCGRYLSTEPCALGLDLT